MLPVSVLVMLLVPGIDKDVVGNAGVAVMFTQIAVLIISIFPTEAALKKTFDENGNRR